MPDQTQAIETPRDAALREWTKKGNMLGGQNFLPESGRCFSCNFDLVDHYQKTGIHSPTSCTRCRHSFVD
jgi:hypothetical protein